MRAMIATRFVASRIGLAAALAAVIWTSPAPCQHYANDPVEELRQALKVQVIDPGRNPDELRYRKKNLEDHIKRLHTAGDLRRALVLQEWLDEDTDRLTAAIDRDVRVELVDRFVKLMHGILTGDDPLAKVAGATMLGEMGITVRGAAARGRGVASLMTKDLAKLTTDPNLSVREAAGKALGSVNPVPAEAVPALSKLLKSDEPALRRSAATGLRNMIQQILSILPAKGRSLTGIEASRPEVVQVGQAVVPAAAPALSDPDPEVRRLATETLHLSAVALGDLVQNPPANLRFPPPGRKVTEEERREMDDYRKEVQDERTELQPLAQALHDGAPVLARVLGDQVPQIRLLACRALEEMANARQRLLKRSNSVPPAPAPTRDKAALGEARDQVVPVAEQAPPTAAPEPIGKGLREVLPALIRALKDPDVDVRRAALDTMELLGEGAAPAAPAIVRSLGDPDLFVRWAATRTLGKTGGAPADVAVPALARLLGDPDLDLRIVAAGVLERFGPPAKGAVPALVQATGKGDAEIRIAAMRALQGVADRDRPTVATALPAVTAELQHVDPRVRRTAAEVLGQFGPLARSSEGSLRTTLNDSDAEVRRAASDALLSVLPRSGL
jgi:HEAT repeat protein